jgi:CMP-N,N'-diacetyllegionaminic acid synthase
MFNDIICVIPARGGSKGIEHKNLQKVGEHPLFVHSVMHAINNNVPKERIVVSSDDDEILKIASVFGVVPHKRSKVNSQDNSSTESCLIEVVQSFYKHHKTDIVTLQPTSPIRRKNLLYDCVYKYKSGDYDSLLTVTELHDFLWFKYHEDGRWFSSYDCRNRPMRQNLAINSVKYFENGNIFISDVEMLLSTKCRIGDNPCIFPISMMESTQIDDWNELKLADLILRGKINEY